MAVLLLGPVVVEADGALSPRDKAILAAMAVQPGRVVAPDQLADAIWGEHPPATWPKQVQACVGRLRKVLGPASIETTVSGYRLALDADELDVHRFAALITRARTLASSGEADRAASTFARALGLWRGQPFAALQNWSPGVSETVRLEELRRSAEEDFLDARLGCGEHRDVAAAAEALVNAEPLRERRWEILALAHYRCGRQGDALRTLQRARRTLVEQLGIDPSRRLAALESAILDQDESLDVNVGSAAVSEECPYKGLASYDVDDHDSFFGRDAQVAACLERLRTTSLLVVTGASGCGKSSLVRAGLAPALARTGRAIVVIVPGADPLAALSDADGDAVLIVDQFEELFAVGITAEAVRSFCSAVAERAGAEFPVIVAIRADHLTGLAADPDLGPFAERALHFVTPLAGNDLRAAIVEPASQAGLRVEHGLVDLLVRDTEGEPGSLPLLSHALVETWRRRDGRVLTVEGYQGSGGIRGAVARSADRLYESLPAEQRPLLRSLMLRLVAPSLEGDPVRCRVAASALRGDAERERIVGLMVRARLLTSEEDTVELAHEALARAWPRLRSWLDEDSAGQRILRHLSAAAEGWESLGRPAAELYRGARLDTAIEYRDSAHPDLNSAEIEFLDASQQHAAADRAALVARARLDAQRNRRLRGALIATALLLIGALVAGLLAFRNSREAEDQRDAAEVAEADSRLEALVNRSLALRSTDRDVAALLAVEAARRWPDDPRATSALLGTFTAPGARGFLGHHYVPGADWLDGALIPGTSSAVISRNGGGLARIDLETGRVADSFPAVNDDDTGFKVRVSSDARLAVQLRWSGEFSVYDVASGALILGPVAAPFVASDVAINDDGSLVAIAGGPSGDLAVYRTDDGAEIGRLRGLVRPAEAGQVWDTAAVAFDRHGLVYLGSVAGLVRIVDPTSLRVVGTMSTPRWSTNEHLVVGGDNVVIGVGYEGIVAASTASRKISWSVDIRGTHPDPCPYFADSVAAERLYCGNQFGVIEERDRNTGQVTGTLDAQLGRVGTLAIGADGEELVAFGGDSAAISRWRLDGSGLVTTVVAEGFGVAGGYDFADGSTLLVAVRDPAASESDDFGDFAVWDPIADRQVDPLNAGGPIYGAGWVGRNSVTWFDADEQRIVWYDLATRSIVDGMEIPVSDSDPAQCERTLTTAGGTRTFCALNNGEVWTIDAATRQRAEPSWQVDGMPVWISATRGGSVVVVTTQELITTVHDGVTGAQIAGPLEGPWVTSVSLDGVLVGATAGNITRYDLATLEPINELPGARGEVNTLQFSDDGSTLLATSLDGTLSVYDVPSGTRLGDPITHDAPFVYGGFLRRDGDAVAATDRTGVAIWDLDPEHLADSACVLAGRNLTPGEWNTYLADFGDYRPTCAQFE